MLGANRIQVTPHVSPDRIEYQTQEWEIGLFEMEPHYHLNILLVIYTSKISWSFAFLNTARLKSLQYFGHLVIYIRNKIWSHVGIEAVPPNHRTKEHSAHHCTTNIS